MKPLTDDELDDLIRTMQTMMISAGFYPTLKTNTVMCVLADLKRARAEREYLASVLAAHDEVWRKTNYADQKRKWLALAEGAVAAGWKEDVLLSAVPGNEDFCQGCGSRIIVSDDRENESCECDVSDTCRSYAEALSEEDYVIWAQQ